MFYPPWMKDCGTVRPRPAKFPLSIKGFLLGGLEHGKKRTMFNKLNNPCLAVHILMTGLREWAIA
jgi:hypothetical protein